MHQGFFTSSCVVAVAVALVTFGCSAPPHDEGAVEEQGAELTSGATSGAPQCPGTGWTHTIVDWRGARGSYMRVGLTPSTEFSQLTIFEDPSDANHGAPAYQRLLGTYALDSGKVILGVDNPAVGPILAFYDATRTTTKDLYFPLAVQRTATSVRAICLLKAWDHATGNVSGATPFLLSKLGM